MSERKLSFTIPQALRFAYGYAESKPAPKAKLTGNRLWNARDISDDLAAITRRRLYDETRRRMESDLDKARQAGDWGKVNKLAALLAKLHLVK